MRHKWKKLQGLKIKGGQASKKCLLCGLHVRVVRVGSVRPMGGWLEYQYRSATKGPYTTVRSEKDIPKCTARVTCPGCKGEGWVDAVGDRSAKTQVIESIIEAYAHVASAPDSSLRPDMAWLTGAAYVAEFSARQMFKNGLIEREDARAIFTATGGDHSDIDGWKR